MSIRPFKVKIQGAVGQFAPKEETIVVAVDEEPPEDMKLETLTFIVSDNDHRLVYRERWPASAVETGKAGRTVKNDTEGPPPSFSWNGRNNQLEAGDQEVFVNPLQSPFTFEVIAELRKGATCEEPPEELSTVDGSVSCGEEEDSPSVELVEEERPAPLLKSLQVTCAGGKSTSRTMLDVYDKTVPVTGDKEKRFCFARGKEEDLKIVWDIDGSEHMDQTAGKLELFPFDGSAAIWTYPLDTLTLKSKGLTENDWKKAKQGLTTFFDTYLVWGNAPYKLMLTLVGNEVKKGAETAWTYIDVVVDSLELFWGESQKLPIDSPPTTDKQFRAQTLKDEVVVLRELKQMDPPRGYEHYDLADLQGEDRQKGITRVSKEPARIEMRSNLFYQDLTDWADSYFGNELYPKCWGDGPRLPIYAQLKVRDASGNSVIAPAALEGARVVWDWDDPCLNKEDGLETGEFLRWAFRRHAQAATDRTDNRCDDDSPLTTNCHREHGGKVGRGSRPVFPLQKGSGDTIESGVFPFEVAQMSNRKWAALSTVYTGPDEDYQCKTGVVFQPSRIGGDTYRVRAYLFTGQDADFNSTIGGEKLWQEARAARLPIDETGILENWRRIDILGYYKKNGNLEALDIGAINEKFADARVKLYLPETIDDQAVGNMWGKLFSDILAAEGKKAGTVARRVYLAETEQKNNGYQFNTKSWTSWTLNAIREALKKLGKKSDGAAYTRALGQNANFWTVHDHLGDAELKHLADEVAAYYQNNPDHIFSGSEQVVPKPLDTVATLRGMAQVYSGDRMFDWYKDWILRRLIGQYIKDPGHLKSDDGESNLKKRTGLHIFHFASPLPTSRTLKGSAFRLLPDFYKGGKDQARKQGMCYFSAEPTQDHLTICLDDMESPGCIGLSPIEFNLSMDLFDSIRHREELEALVTVIRNAAACKIIERIDPDDPLPKEKKRTADPEGLVWERAVDLYSGYVNVRIKGGRKTNVEKIATQIRALGEVKIKADAASTIQSEREIFLSRSAVFSPDTSHRVHFKSHSYDLTKKVQGTRLDASILQWLSVCYCKTLRPLESLHVFYRDTDRGRRRAKVATDYLAGVLRLVERRLMINNPIDIRPVVHDHRSERDVFVSLDKNFDTKKTTQLRFAGYGSASVYKTDINTRLRKFARKVKKAARGNILPPVYVYYKDTDNGRHRKQKVAGYLSALLAVGETGRNWQLDAEYDLNALAAHEIGHTLFLMHAPPTDKNEWVHVKDYNCLMNYDGNGDSFCGICILQMRGWNIGSQFDSKLPNAPVHGGAWITVPGYSDSSDTPEDNALLVPPPLTDPGNSVGPVLGEIEVIGGEASIGGNDVTAVAVHPQGGPQGGLNTCGFHSIKNALYLQHYVEAIRDRQGRYRKRQLAQPLHNLILSGDPNHAAARFSEVFVGTGDQGNPQAGSWLAIARGVGNMPDGADQSIGAPHQLEILRQLRADTALLPADGGGALSANTAVKIAVSLDFAPDYTLMGGPEVPQAIRVLREMQAAGRLTRSFTCAIGAHFITVVANKYETGSHDLEFMVADSLNRSLAANSLAVQGVAAWIADTDCGIARSNFEHLFFDDLSRRLPKQEGDLARPDVDNSTIEEIVAFVDIFENAIVWLEAAGLMTQSSFRRYTDVIKGYLNAFPDRLLAIDTAQGDTLKTIKGSEQRVSDHIVAVNSRLPDLVGRLP